MALALTYVSLKVAPIEGALILTNSSQSVIIDPFTDSLEDDPSILLTPDSANLLSNEEITGSYVHGSRLLVPSASSIIEPSNLNPPFRSCMTEPSKQTTSSEAVYKIKGQSDVNELSGTNGPKTFEIKLDIDLKPSSSIPDINDIIKSTIKYGDKEVDLRIDNDEGFKTECNNNAGSVPLLTTSMDAVQQVQQNPPFRECLDNAAPTVHAIYTIKFGNTNIDNVLQVADGREDVEIILTNDLINPVKGTSGQLSINGGNDHSLGAFDVESSCEMIVT